MATNLKASIRATMMGAIPTSVGASGHVFIYSGSAPSKTAAPTGTSAITAGIPLSSTMGTTGATEGAVLTLSGTPLSGTATCIGGKHPDPPLDAFPLLAWMVSHPRHGSKVFTEDGAASVEAIALDAAVTPSYEALAAEHRTTAEHVRQAIEYAIKAGFLGVN